MRLVSYGLNRGNARETHLWAVDFHYSVIRGEACSMAALALKDQAQIPEIILAHRTADTHPVQGYLKSRSVFVLMFLSSTKTKTPPPYEQWGFRIAS